MAEIGAGHWHITFSRDVQQWGHDFTEHWTYRHKDGTVVYKLRVVGPNGEACKREEMDKGNVPRAVREAFKDTFRNAGKKA